MPIKFSLPIKGRIADVEALAPERVARAIELRIQEPIRNFLTRALSQEAPARTDVKFVWSLNKAANARARRWWFYHLRKGDIPTDGRHYKRSGKLASGWVVNVKRQGNVITIDASNPAKGSEYVYGSETQRQIPGHATTGWPEAQEILLLAAEFTEDELQDILDQEIDRILRG